MRSVCSLHALHQVRNESRQRSGNTEPACLHQGVRALAHQVPRDLVVTAMNIKLPVNFKFKKLKFNLKWILLAGETVLSILVHLQVEFASL